ncbi:MAG: type IV pilus biogenesis protein PilM, partial [Nitrospiraceae bacterium]
VHAEISSEIARSVDYLKTTYPDQEVNKLLLCGGCAKLEGLAQQLTDRLGVPVMVANPFKQIETSSCDVTRETLAELAPLAAVSVGLAMRRIGDR